MDQANEAGLYFYESGNYMKGDNFVRQYNSILKKKGNEWEKLDTPREMERKLLYAYQFEGRRSYMNASQSFLRASLYYKDIPKFAEKVKSELALANISKESKILAKCR